MCASGTGPPGGRPRVHLCCRRRSCRPENPAGSHWNVCAVAGNHQQARQFDRLCRAMYGCSSRLTARRIRQCHRCRRHASIASGTVFGPERWLCGFRASAYRSGTTGETRGHRHGPSSSSGGPVQLGLFTVKVTLQADFRVSPAIHGGCDPGWGPVFQEINVTDLETFGGGEARGIWKENGEKYISNTTGYGLKCTNAHGGKDMAKGSEIDVTERVDTR